MEAASADDKGVGLLVTAGEGSGNKVVTAVRARPISAAERESGAINVIRYDGVSGKGLGVVDPNGQMVQGSERYFQVDIYPHIQSGSIS
jgi:hypothetical protein